MAVSTKSIRGQILGLKRGEQISFPLKSMETVRNYCSTIKKSRDRPFTTETKDNQIIVTRV